MKKRTHVEVKSEKLCRKCEGKMKERIRKYVRKRDLSKNYVYSRAEVCLKCGTLWLHEKDKVDAEGYEIVEPIDPKVLPGQMKLL